MTDDTMSHHTDPTDPFWQSRPEPSTLAHRGTFGHVWPCPLFYVGNWKRGEEEYYPVKGCSNAAACERSEPQAEPSDALHSRIESTLDRYETIYGGMRQMRYIITDIRKDLAAVTEQGENR